jgi:alpha-1,3-rhamnosyl/mannosyltransferase
VARIGIDGRSLDVERTGIGRYLENLLREWARAPRGHQFRVYGMKPQSLEHEHRVVAFESPAQADLFGAELARDPVDAFFSPLYELSDAVTGPSVVTIHDLVHEATPEAFNAVQLGYLRRRHADVVERASWILTDSRFARDEIAARFPEAADRLEVIPLAADPRFTPGDGDEILRRELPGLERPYYLYAGPISAKRHIPALIEAFRPLEGTLCLVGRNYLPRPQALDEAVAACPRAMHLPYVSNELLLALYREALAFVYLSSYEGFGMPPLEAMACGTPTVVADAASLPEVVGDAALRVRDPEDVDEIRAALRALAAPARRREAREKGLAQAGRFSWTESAARTLHAIERALRA